MALISYAACEIIKVAIEIEKNGYRFYTEAAKLTKSSSVAELFRNLAQEEIQHQAFFEGLAKLISQCATNGTNQPDEYLSAIADASIIQQKRGMKAIAAGQLTDQEALDIAIQVEKNAILYYTELLRFVTDKEKGMVQELVAEEKRHLTNLTSIGKNLT
ncbi:MAG: ferritin family protein [Candidatus Omnitrophica bacterium]|nr:ferritin family protein [Candidatus Omnitrophota bacterium]